MNWTDFIIAIKQGLIPSKKELVDGTTTVGNANKLGGKGASEYFLKSGGDIDGTLHARGATDTPIYNHANSSTDESYIGYAVGDTLRGYMGFKNGKAHIHNVGDIATTADLANYLPKTNTSKPTVTTANNDVITFNNNLSNGTHAWLNLHLKGEEIGAFGFNQNKKPQVWVDNTAKEVLHSGNVGDYALVKNGGGTITKGYRTVIALNNSDGASSSVLFESYGASLGELGVSNTGATEVPFFKEKNNGTTRILLHEGNVGDYALIKNGGSANNIYVKNVDNGHGFLYKNHSANADYGTYLKDIDAQGRESGICVQSNVGGLEYLDVNGNWHNLLHTGNSAKVAIQSTAPTDTSALWVW